MLTSLVLASAFLLVTDQPAQRLWAELAVPGYVLSLFLAVRPRTSAAAAPVAAVASVVVPTCVLVFSGTGQPEVGVVERAADAWLHSGTPYLTQPTSVNGFRPYLPATFLFGLLPGVLGDIRVWGLLLLAVALWTARTLGYRAAAGCAASSGAGRQSGVSKSDPVVVLTLSFPVVALAVAASGIDVPAAACVLAAICVVPSRRGWLTAGLLLGAATAMKPTGVCAVFTTAVALGQTRGPATAVRFVVTAVLAAAAFVVPSLLTGAQAVWENVFVFPSGGASIRSPADSPFPGVLLREAGLPHWLGLGVLFATAGMVSGWCLARPGQTSLEIARQTAVLLTVIYLFAPFSRVGYLVVPALVYFPVRAYLGAGDAAGPSQSVLANDVR